MQGKPIKYTDKVGQIRSKLLNAEVPFRVLLNHNEFTFDLEDLRPIEGQDIDERFELDALGNLTNYELETNIQIKVLQGLKTVDTVIGFKLINGKHNGGSSLIKGELNLKMDDNVYQTNQFVDFEQGIKSLNNTLPSGIKILCCFNCQLSDYSPAGNGFYGMMCFKNSKNEYLNANTKDDFFGLVDKSSWTGEADYCEKFEPRIKGTGYRG